MLSDVLGNVTLEDLHLPRRTQHRRHGHLALCFPETVTCHELAVVRHQLVGRGEELVVGFVVVVAAETAQLALVDFVHLG